MTDYRRAYDNPQRRSKKQEKDGAARHGGQVNPGSGNGSTHKNDVRTADTSIEFKTTKAASYSLRVQDLAMAWQYASVSGRDLVFGIEFSEAPDYARRWVVLPEDDYLALRDRALD